VGASTTVKAEILAALSARSTPFRPPSAETAAAQTATAAQIVAISRPRAKVDPSG